MEGPQLIGSRYRVLRTLGAGGMGRVYEAMDEALQRRVAIKLIVRSTDENHQLQARFTREARLLARVAHPNIVAVHDMGVQDGEPYLVMELLEGVDLHRLMAARAPLGHRVVRAVASGMCAGLAAAHAAGVLHRDVKPSNVHLTRQGRVVLEDFGIAHLFNLASTVLTSTGAMIGTPAFLSPEAVTGGAAGPHSDLYSLGVCMYEMLSGRQPFSEPGGAVHALLYRIVNDAVPRLREADVPGDLADLVADLMAKKPDDRPTADEVLTRLSCPPDADRIVAAAVTGEVRDRAVESFDLDQEPATAAPTDLPGRPVATDDATRYVTLSAATRASILRAMSPGAAEVKQREAVNLVLRGSLEEAVELLSTLAEVWRSTLGPDHPSTLTCQYWQGVCLARLGAGGEAMARFAAVSSATHRALTQQQLARLE